MEDIYQERYLAHQKRKKEMLTPAYKETHIKQKKNPKFIDVLKARKSTRIFGDGEVDLSGIYKAIDLAPSSCNRKGVFVKMIDLRKDKSLLSGLLVGGVGWIHRADVILLLLADMNAYKSPNEREFMPYLDAGVLAANILLAAEADNIASCFVNPNLNGTPVEYGHIFPDFVAYKFCGAIALGNYKNNE